MTKTAFLHYDRNIGEACNLLEMSKNSRKCLEYMYIFFSDPSLLFPFLNVDVIGDLSAPNKFYALVWA